MDGLRETFGRQQHCSLADNPADDPAKISPVSVVSQPQKLPANVNGLSLKVATGEAAIIVAEAVLGNIGLLSIVIKYALESSLEAALE